ncbi:MAG: flagellar basal body P-ring formation protein FlgA [Acidobacteria bacterium]|nr:flagellar basal body P-ring formation protein FlgA [Acidobacteriota bacterium]
MLHSVRYPVTAAVLFMVMIQGLYGVESVRIRLMERAHVNAGKVLLKDIASLDGKHPDSIGTIENLPVGDAPEFGTVATFSRHQIEKIIKRAARAPEIKWTGAPIVQIRLRSREAKAEEIAPLLKDILAAATPWRDPEIEILSIKNPEEIELPYGVFDLRISRRSPVLGRGRILAPFDIVREGRILASFWVTADVRVRAEILAAVKNIPYRKKIDADDIDSVLTEIEDLDAAFLRDPGEVIGKISKRSFSPGDPLTRDSFEKPFLVKSGDTVNLRLERSGLVVNSQARAEQDGRLDQVIRVRNLEFSSVLKAKVTGRGQVEIP